MGEIDPVHLAEQLSRVIDESNVTKLETFSPIEAFIGWFQDYAALARDGKPVIPPELAGVDPDSYRLIQACQMDRRGSWWVEAEGASDGWAVRVPEPAWLARHFFSPVEDFKPGSQYKLFVRARGEHGEDRSGRAWQFGVHPDGPPAVEVAAEDTPGESWAVYETVPWTAQDGQSFWVALPRPQSMDAVLVDCIWLVEIQ